MSIDFTVNRLREGHQRFISGKNPLSFNCHNKSQELLLGQKPYAAILSCTDSRVIPELIFDAGPGELFVIRVAGHVANTDSIASMEYAVTYLKVQVLIVLGHQNCGAIQQALLAKKPHTSSQNSLAFPAPPDPTNQSPHLNHLLAQIEPAILAQPSQNTNEIEKTHVKLICEILKNRSSLIKNTLKEKKLKIIPAYYSLETRTLEFLKLDPPIHRLK